MRDRRHQIKQDGGDAEKQSRREKALRKDKLRRGEFDLHNGTGVASVA